MAVLLVALSIVGGYLHGCDRLNKERIRTHLLDLAHTISYSPQVREAFVMQNPALVLQPLGQGIRSRTAAELVIILGQDGTCYAHPNPSRLHKPFQEAGVQKALAGHDVITRSARGDEPTLYAFTPIYARTGQTAWSGWPFGKTLSR